MIRSTEYQRGYDAGYKQALLDALRGNADEGVPRYPGLPRSPRPRFGENGR